MPYIYANANIVSMVNVLFELFWLYVLSALIGCISLSLSFRHLFSADQVIFPILLLNSVPFSVSISVSHRSTGKADASIPITKMDKHTKCRTELISLYISHFWTKRINWKMTAWSIWVEKTSQIACHHNKWNGKTYR